MMDKRAQTDTILNWVFYRLPIMIIVVVFFFLILSSYYTTGLTSHDVENLIMIERLTYSQDLLAYEDINTHRVYPGIVDISKFDTEHLEENLKNPNNNIAVNLELTYLDTDETKRAYVNEKQAKAWDDYVAVGGYDLSWVKRYVKVYENDVFRPGILRIKVITKNG